MSCKGSRHISQGQVADCIGLPTQTAQQPSTKTHQTEAGNCITCSSKPRFMQTQEFAVAIAATLLIKQVITQRAHLG